METIELGYRDLLGYSHKDLVCIARHLETDSDINFDQLTREQLAASVAVRLYNRKAHFGEDIGEYVTGELFKNKVVDFIDDPDNDDNDLKGFIKNRKIGGYLFLTIDGISAQHEYFDVIEFKGVSTFLRSFREGLFCYIQDLPLSDCYEEAYTVNTLKMILNRLPAEETKKAIWEGLKNHYKIHLQPKKEHFYEVVTELYRMWKNGDLPIRAMKYAYNIYDTHVLGGNNPAIVIYPEPGYENAKKVVQTLKKVFPADYGLGKTPRGNRKVNDLVYYAGGNWDDKKLAVNKNIFTSDLTLYKGQKPLD